METLGSPNQLHLSQTDQPKTLLAITKGTGNGRGSKKLSFDEFFQVEKTVPKTKKGKPPSVLFSQKSLSSDPLVSIHKSNDLQSGVEILGSPNQIHPSHTDQPKKLLAITKGTGNGQEYKKLSFDECFSIEKIDLTTKRGEPSSVLSSQKSLPSDPLVSMQDSNDLKSGVEILGSPNQIHPSHTDQPKKLLAITKGTGNGQEYKKLSFDECFPVEKTVPKTKKGKPPSVLSSQKSLSSDPLVSMQDSNDLQSGVEILGSPNQIHPSRTDQPKKLLAITKGTGTGQEYKKLSFDECFPVEKIDLTSKKGEPSSVLYSQISESSPHEIIQSSLNSNGSISSLLKTSPGHEICVSSMDFLKEESQYSSPLVNIKGSNGLQSGVEILGAQIRFIFHILISRRNYWLLQRGQEMVKSIRSCLLMNVSQLKRPTYRPRTASPHQCCPIK